MVVRKQQIRTAYMWMQERYLRYGGKIPKLRPRFGGHPLQSTCTNRLIAWYRVTCPACRPKYRGSQAGLAANKKTRTAKHNIPYQIYFTSQNPYFFNRNQSLTVRFTTK